MKHATRRLLVFVMAALMLLPAAAFAVTQEDVGTDAPVVFYENYINTGKTAEPAIPSAEAEIELDDMISNVFIGRDDIVVVLYSEKNFTGDKIVLDTAGMHTMPNYNFNDKASSYEIYLKAPVAFYEHVDGSGWSYEAANPSSGDAIDFPNDEMSGVLIPDDNTVVVLYEHANFEGTRLELNTAGLHDLEALGFNDIVSSYEVRAK